MLCHSLCWYHISSEYATYIQQRRSFQCTSIINQWCHHVVPTVWCNCLFCERKLLDSHPNNSRHPIFQTSHKNVMVNSMNVKEFDNFFWGSVAICPFFVQIPSKIVNSVFLSKMLNLMILSIFHPNQFCSVPTQLSFYHSHHLLNTPSDINLQTVVLSCTLSLTIL